MDQKIILIHQSLPVKPIGILQRLAYGNQHKANFFSWSRRKLTVIISKSFARVNYHFPLSVLIACLLPACKIYIAVINRFSLINFKQNQFLFAYRSKNQS